MKKRNNRYNPNELKFKRATRVGKRKEKSLKKKKNLRRILNAEMLFIKYHHPKLFFTFITSPAR